jgi:5-formyltetrahydrofolate cyclo-ligase
MKKSEIRSDIKAKRKSLSQNDVNFFSTSCFSQLLDKFTFIDKNIGLFFPIQKFNEPNMFLFFDELIVSGANIYAPKSDFTTNTMEYHLIKSINDLQVNEFGIPEPKFEKKIEAKELDFIMIPLLAINKKGYRVGYGKGFYDRFLLNCKKKTLKIGVNLLSDFTEIEDINPNDIPLDYCVNPKKIVCFNDKD